MCQIQTNIEVNAIYVFDNCYPVELERQINGRLGAQSWAILLLPALKQEPNRP